MVLSYAPRSAAAGAFRKARRAATHAPMPVGLRRLIGESRALRQIAAWDIVFVGRGAMLTYTSTLPEAEHARPCNRTGGGVGYQRHRPRAHGVGEGRRRAGRHAVRARHCRR